MPRSKLRKLTVLYSVYTDSLTYLSREAQKDGLDSVASEIDRTKRKIELLNHPRADKKHYEIKKRL